MAAAAAGSGRRFLASSSFFVVEDRSGVGGRRRRRIGGTCAAVRDGRSMSERVQLQRSERLSPPDATAVDVALSVTSTFEQAFGRGGVVPSEVRAIVGAVVMSHARDVLMLYPDANASMPIEKLFHDPL